MAANTPLLTYSDFAAGAISGATAWFHSQSHPEKQALWSVISSMAGRFASAGLSGGNLDAFTNNTLTPTAKDHISAFGVRALICRMSNEKGCWTKGWDFLVADITADELLRVFGATDQALLPRLFGGDGTLGPAGPTAGTNASGARL